MWKNVEKFIKTSPKIINEYYSLKNQFGNVIKNWVEFKKMFKDKYEKPFKALKEFNSGNCGLFVDWLDYYIQISANRMLYRIIQMNINDINNNNEDGCGINEFKELNEYLIGVKWIKKINGLN